MGLFDKLFGNKKQTNASQNQNLQTEFNVMKNISLGTCKKHQNSEHYKLIENGIYQDLKDDDAKFRMILTFELEPNDCNNQYPLEDILDKYYMHVSDFLETENKEESNTFKFEFGGALSDLKNAQTILGKKVFNREFLDENNQVRVKLIIE